MNRFTKPRCEQDRRRADVCCLEVLIRGDRYNVRHVPTETAEVIKAWRLTKEAGDTYVVADTIDGAQCECPWFIFRHMGKDQTGCKHIRALRALTLIDPEGNSPDEWPAWTDTHAFTSR